MIVRSVADVAAAETTVAAYNSQSPNTAIQATPQTAPPSLSMVEPTPKSKHPRTPETHHRHHHLDHGNADLDEGGALGGHDAPNWSRTKSSMILLGATILYAVIAGLSPCGCVNW